MEKKHIIGIIAAIVLISTFVASFIYYTNIIKAGYHYTYKGVDGSEYSFDVVRLEGVSGLFNKAYFSLLRDDGKIYKYYTLFRNSPMDLEDIPLQSSSQSILYNGNDKKNIIYITQDPNLPADSGKISSLAVLDITKITGSLGNNPIYGVQTKTAFTNLTSELQGSGIKEITCKDADNETGVIVIKLGDSDKIYKENKNCVVLEAKSYKDITRVADKFVMHLIGIF